VSDLEESRKKIDDIDRQLVELMNQRAQIARHIGSIKRSRQDAPASYAPDRDRAVLDKIQSANRGPLPDRCLVAVYRELMSGSFFLERPLRIAYLGPEGSFSHTAAMMKFGQSVEYEPQSAIAGVFEEIAREHCDFGIVPVDNTIAGGIVETLDSLTITSVHICAEVLVAIHHNLLANCELDKIKTIYSKPEVFSQCNLWLSTTMPQIDTIPMASTAIAAQKAAAEPYTAAIGSKLAGELYGLKTICENIENVTTNVTRFFVVGRESARATGDDRSTLVFSTADKAGALVECLKEFQKHQVNLSNIESRPSQTRDQEYHFFVDCQGHQSDEKLKNAVDQVRNHCLRLTILGSYPRVTEVL